MNIWLNSACIRNFNNLATKKDDLVKRMGKVLQRRYTDGQKVYGKMFNTAYQKKHES